MQMDNSVKFRLCINYTFSKRKNVDLWSQGSRKVALLVVRPN